MKIIRIFRPVQYADLFRSYRLMVDGVEVAKISAGSHVELGMPSGLQTISAKIDWCSSNSIIVDCTPEEPIILEVGSNLFGWRLFCAMLYLTVYSSQYLYLRRTTP